MTAIEATNTKERVYDERDKDFYRSIFHQIGLYNPQRQSDEVTEKLFTVHQKQFELLIGKIILEKRDNIPQHYLIIGEWGMGKSTLLKRMEVELHKEHYRHRFLPLLFPEEQNNLKGLAEFWLNHLTALVKSLKSEKYPADKLADMLKNRDEIAKKTTDVISEEAYKYFMSICQKLYRRPVLLIDNIGLILSKLDTDKANKQEQWHLRKLFSENGAPIVVSTDVAAVDDIKNQGMPFYDFFQMHYLNKLNYEEFEKLLKHLATVINHEEQIFTSMQANNSRLRTLFELTDGSPRTAVRLFKHLVHGFSTDINDDLEIVIDEMTPLYKAKFEKLPKQQQIIIDAIAMNWDAISLNKLSKTTHYANNQLSPQLNRLINDGWIETVVADKKSRKVQKETEGIIKGNAYFISDRFFNSWYLLRYNTIKDGIYCLSKFLECFYEKEEEENLSDKLDQALFELQNKNENLAQKHFLQAFEDLEKENKIASMAKESCWVRFGYDAIDLGYGSWLLAILEEKGYDIVLSPYYTALQAVEIEKQDSKNSKKDAEIYLKNRAVEISGLARVIISKIALSKISITS